MTSKLINFYEKPATKKYLNTSKNPGFDDTQMKINSRTMIIGSSGSGKTLALLNYIALCKNTFHAIYICTKMEEPLYQLLYDTMKKTGRVHILYNELSKLPPVDDIREKKEDATLVVFDDYVCDKKAMKSSLIADYFIRGRKQNVTCVFLTQSYFEVPKLYRSQMQYIILLKISSFRDLKLIFSDFQFGDDKDAFVRIYNEATGEFPNFLKISIDEQDFDKKFSKNFTDFFRVKGGGVVVVAEKEIEKDDNDENI